MKETRPLLVYTLVAFSLFSLLALVLESAYADHQVSCLQSYCSDNWHYDQGSKYENNLYTLLSELSSKANTTKFYNSTQDKVHGMFLCSSIDSNQVCQDCVTRAAGEIAQRCQYSAEAVIWYTGCMLRYAARSIFSTIDVSIFYINITGPVLYSQHNQQLLETFVSLFRTATTSNSTLMSATTEVPVTDDISVSCHVDCTPDIGSSECQKCFQTALGRFALIGTQSGKLLQPSCWLMYNFSDAGSPFKAGKERNITLGVISAVAAASLLVNVFLCLLRSKGTAKPTGLDEIKSMENLHFEFDAIRTATDNFSASNKLGRGGFGVVYLGTLADGQAVAVKRLSNTSGQGIREFKTEACLAAKLQHKNLVKVFGFCLEGEEMLLVYEFVSNKSLDRFLSDPKRRAYLRWQTRYKIIVGIARGLLYLHEDSRPKIIHRDLKPSNILLDGKMNPKIADFGMAKLFGADQTQGNTSRVAGTFGYMAPEYATTGHFSTKSDIFSYGVILLEIISGLRNYSPRPDSQDENLLNYVWKLWNEEAQLTAVDSALENDNCSKDEVERCIHVGLLCIQEDPAKRPNIASVLLMLNSEPVTLPVPVSPPSFPYSRIRPEKSTVPHESYGIQTEDAVTELSPR